jgi:UDP-3-O-[3-hydroxymyristoyl] glucosamine N-acyltransferase
MLKELVKNKSVKIIGYEESALTQQYVQLSKQEEYVNIAKKYNVNSVDLISPEEFLSLQNKNDYQYFLAFSLDIVLKNNICNILDEENLDCPTFIDDTSVIHGDCKIGKGVFIGPFSTIQNCTIENYCIIESYCLLSHDVVLGKNSILHSGSMIAGKTKIGKNCNFGFKSGVINKVNIVDNVNLGAFSNITKDITKPGKYVGTIARYVGEWL